MNDPMKHLYPDNFARFYDIMYHKLRDGIDNDFFLNNIKQVNGKVLEIGTGTGRFFIDALTSGADIYGIDISEPMLNILRSKIGPDQHYRISIKNIVDFDFDFKFDLIIAPFRVMMHIIEKDDQIASLNNVFNHLNPGGRFIFDTFVPDLRQLIDGLDNVTDFEGEYLPGKLLRRTVSTHPDLVNQLLNIEFNLEWEEESRTMSEMWSLPLRFFFRYELEHLVERSEFNSYRILGDYTGRELSKDSKEFIVICKRS
jgi:SAM-dependent methyltransferase